MLRYKLGTKYLKIWKYENIRLYDNGYSHKLYTADKNKQINTTIY